MTDVRDCVFLALPLSPREFFACATVTPLVGCAWPVQGLVDRVPLGVPFRLPPTRSICEEVVHLTTIPPFVQRWRSTITRHDVVAPIRAFPAWLLRF
jgi:hypothetical protein